MKPRHPVAALSLLLWLVSVALSVLVLVNVAYRAGQRDQREGEGLEYVR